MKVLETGCQAQPEGSPLPRPLPHSCTLHRAPPSSALERAPLFGFTPPSMQQTLLNTLSPPTFALCPLAPQTQETPALLSPSDADIIDMGRPLRIRGPGADYQPFLKVRTFQRQ